MAKRIYIITIIIFACSVVSTVSAQTDRQFIRNGNQLYHQQKFDKAEIEYRKALAKNSQNPQAIYNLACALMMQNKDSLAIIQYTNAGKLEKNKIRKAKVYHNIGCIFQKHKQYSTAITAYEESLRNNPNDNETRYNLALCKQLQKKDKNKNNGGGNNNKHDKKQNRQNKSNRNNKQNKSKQQQQQQNGQMSKDNAEQLLNAAIQQENATRQRMQRANQRYDRRRLEKNW